MFHAMGFSLELQVVDMRISPVVLSTQADSTLVLAAVRTVAKAILPANNEVTTTPMVNPDRKLLTTAQAHHSTLNVQNLTWASFTVAY